LSRTLSSAFISALNDQETGEVVVALLTVTHADLDAPIRLSSDPTVRTSDDPLIYSTESRSNTFIFLPFTFTIPDDRSDATPRVRLEFDNIDRQMVALLRSILSPPSVLMEIVLASSPDTVEIELPSMVLGDVTITDTTISGTLVVDPLINEPYPAGSFTPGAFPGLF